MQNNTASMGETQEFLLRELLHHKSGLTIEAMAEKLDISRNAVRQHLIAMERDGLVARGETRATGGRPHQLYILTERGAEHFPRQYSWFSDLLLQSLKAQGSAAAGDTLAAMGQAVGMSMRPQVPADPASSAQLQTIADEMTALGYDATAAENAPVIEAHNCVFHQLASRHPEVCRFDLGLLSSASGCQVEQLSCMVRGGASCRFHFQADQKK